MSRHLDARRNPKPERLVATREKLPPQGGGGALRKAALKGRKGNPSHLFPGKPKPPKVADSWWIGLSPAALNAEAHRRHPDGSTARSIVPTRGARGAIAGTGL